MDHDTAVRDMERRLGTRIYPGTEILRDVDGGRLASCKTSARGDALVPQPADDAADPLNWAPRWKAAVLGSAVLLTFALNVGPLALAPMLGSLQAEFGVDLEQAVAFTGVAILTLGFSNFLWVPVMAVWGRRPVALAGVVLCIASSVWRARASSRGSFMGACVLNGIGAGPCETLMPQVVADIVFLHDRGTYQTLFFSTFSMAITVGPVIAGAMDYHVGWRSFWWFNASLLGATLVVLLLLFPETKYERVDVLRPSESDDQKDQKDPTVAIARQPAPVQSVTPDRFLGTSSPSRTHFRLCVRQPATQSARDTARLLLRQLWLPWYLFSLPVVAFAALVVAWSSAGFLVVNLSQAQAFAAPPYSFSPQTVGLFNLSVLAWMAVGLATCGPLSDAAAAWLTRRNGGVREPEMRLVALVPYAAALVAGSVVTAVGYDRHWPWPVIVVVGYGLLGLQVTALPSIATTYAVDSYKPATGSLFVAVTVARNVWGFGVARFLPRWAEHSGFTPPILANMGLCLFFVSLGGVFWAWGKELRGRSRHSFVHHV